MTAIHRHVPLAAALALAAALLAPPAADAEKVFIRDTSGAVTVGDDTTVIVEPGGFVRAPVDAVFGDDDNHLIVRGRVKGDEDGVDFNSGVVDIYGRIEGGDDAIEFDENDGTVFVRMGGAALGDVEGIDVNNAKIYNWGFIRGGQVGIDYDFDGGHSRRGLLINYSWGTIRGGETGVRFSPGFDLRPDTRITIKNWGLITGNVGIDVGSPDIGLKLRNHGIVRGDEAGIRFQNGGNNVFTLGGIGTIEGGIDGGDGEDDVLRLRGLKGVPWDVKLDLMDLSGRDLDGEEVYLGPKLGFARGWDRIEVGRIISYEEKAPSGLSSLGAALDYTTFHKIGTTSRMLGSWARLRGEDRDKGFETLSGRAFDHSYRDVFLWNDRLLSLQLQHHWDDQYLEEKLAREAGEQDDARWTAWVRGFHNIGDQDPSVHRVDADWTTSGAFGGLDYRIEPDKRTGTRVGVFGGYTYTRADVDDFDSHYDSNDIYLGINGNMNKGIYQGSGAAWYTFHDLENTRYLKLDGFNSRATSDPDAHQFSMFWNNSLRIEEEDSPCWAAPQVGFGYSRLHVRGFDENGAGDLNLNVTGQDADSLWTSLGFRTGSQFALGPVTLRPEFHALYIHEFLDHEAGISKRFDDPAISSFTVRTKNNDRDYALVGANLSAQMTECDCLDVTAGYDASLGANERTDHTVQVGLRYQF